MFSINDLVGGLLNAGNRLAKEDGSDLRTDGGSTTIRLDPELRRFLDAHSKTMGGASLQNVVSMILTGVMRASLDETAATRVDRLRNRVFELFDRHGIDIPTMSEVLQDLDCPLSRDALVEKLDNKLLDQLTEMFSVRRTWLLGQEPYISEVWKKSFYNKSFHMMEHVIDLKTRSICNPTVWMLTRGTFDRKTWDMTGHQADKGRDNYMIAVVVEMKRRTNAGTEFSTFESWGSVPWFHIPTRTEFRAIAKFLSDPPGELQDTYADAFRNGYTFFIPRDDIDSRCISVDPEIYDAFFVYSSITFHEVLSAARGLGCGWSQLECGREFAGKDADHETKQVWDNFSTIVEVLDRSRPWLPPEERPGPREIVWRKMNDIIAATKAAKGKGYTAA